MKLATTWCSLSATFAQRFDWTNLFCVFVRKVKSFSRRFRIVCMFGDVALDKNKNKMRSQSPRNIQSLQYSYLLVTGASLPIYCLVPAPNFASTNQHAAETCQGEVFIRRVRLEFGLTNSSRKNKLASQWTQHYLHLNWWPHKASFVRVVNYSVAALQRTLYCTLWAVCL